MLIMDQKVTTQPILGELNDRGIKFLTLRMQSPALITQINTLTPTDFTTITLDRPGAHSRPKVHESTGVHLTNYPGTVRQFIVTGPKMAPVPGSWHRVGTGARKLAPPAGPGR